MLIMSREGGKARFEQKLESGGLDQGGFEQEQEQEQEQESNRNRAVAYTMILKINSSFVAVQPHYYSRAVYL